MKFSEFKAKTKLWNQFSKVDILGAYDFYTSSISLEALKEDDIRELRKLFPQVVDTKALAEGKKLTPEQYTQLSKIYPLAVHEYTHFVDSTSTLWGLRHLNLMNEAYLSDNTKGGEESGFYKAREFYDHVRNIRLPDYYTVVHMDPPDSRPWQSRITIGRSFTTQGKPSQRSILFSRFANFQGDLLARSPISTVSLLEASAMSQEILRQVGLIENTDEDFRIVERANFASRTLNHLYNRNITEYSVCVHVLANHLGCKDSLAAFIICANLSRIVLNFPKTAFDVVLAHCPVAELLGIQKGDEFEKAIIDGVQSHDLGAIYYLLCKALPKDSHESRQKAREGIATAIKTIGIDYQVFKGDAQAEAKILFESMESSQIKSVLRLAKAGYENFHRIDIEIPELDFDAISVPPAYLGDSSIWQVLGSQSDKNLLAQFDIDECFYELHEGQSWVERFSEACI